LDYLQDHKIIIITSVFSIWKTNLSGHFYNYTGKLFHLFVYKLNIFSTHIQADSVNYLMASFCLSIFYSYKYKNRCVCEREKEGDNMEKALTLFQTFREFSFREDLVWQKWKNCSCRSGRSVKMEINFFYIFSMIKWEPQYSISYTIY